MPIKATMKSLALVFAMAGAMVFAGAAGGLTGTASAQDPNQDTPDEAPGEWVIIVHGGAWSPGLTHARFPDAQDALYRQGLNEALAIGAQILDEGGSALDAVEATIKTLEDNPAFNAGRGSVLTAGGGVEMDASIMRGDTLNAGAVAVVTTTRNPISAARKVMENSPYVLLSGAGADAFATEQGLTQEDPAFFITRPAWDGLVRTLTGRGDEVPARPDHLDEGVFDGVEPLDDETWLRLDADGNEKFGTVGVVALDRSGLTAAGTSTGGRTGKEWNRIGDSPIIGASTYADGPCGISSTGAGEYFIRLTIAARICFLAKDMGYDPRASIDLVIHDKLTGLGGEGGVIGVINGEPLFAMNTSVMLRAIQREGGEPQVALYADEY